MSSIVRLDGREQSASLADCRATCKDTDLLYSIRQIRPSTLSAASLASFSITSSLVARCFSCSFASLLPQGRLPLVLRLGAVDLLSSARSCVMTSSYTLSTRSCSFSPAVVGSVKSICNAASVSVASDLLSCNELPLFGGQTPFVTSFVIRSTTLSGSRDNSSRIADLTAFVIFFCNSE